KENLTGYASVRSVEIEKVKSQVVVTADRVLWTSNKLPAGLTAGLSGHYYDPTTQHASPVTISQAFIEEDGTGARIQGQQMPQPGATVVLNGPSGKFVLSVEESREKSVRGNPFWIPDAVP